MVRDKGTVKIKVNIAWCKRCGICVAFCPMRVFVVDENGYPSAANADACSQCSMCELLCPDQAMGLYLQAESEEGRDDTD